MSQMTPMEPVVRKAACQPYLKVTKATSGGAMEAETVEAGLKRAVARGRSTEGNHSVVALMAAGKLPDSPRPSSVRAMQKPMTLVTRAWPIEENAQMGMAMAYP